MSLPPNQDLEDRLTSAAKLLLQPPSSLDELLTLLDGIEELLSKVPQSPATSMQSAMSPLMKTLVSEELMKHSDVDVRVGAAACISEITRITAPEAPYDDEKMKDIFQLMVSSFENLSDTSNRSYKKRACILETVAKVRSCVIMLDLELDQMIIEMFQHFLKSIRVHHAGIIFESMSIIMNLVLEESEDISPDLLCPILDALKKNNKEVLPIAKKLAERVIENGADKLRPCLEDAVNTLNASLDDYNEVVASVCKKSYGSFGHSDENILKDQPEAKDVKEETKPQEKDPALNGSHKSTACNSLNKTGDEEMLNQQPILAGLKQQFDAQSTSKTESDMGVQNPDRVEVKPEHVANGEARPANCRNNSAESSDIVDDEKQGEQVPCNQEIPSEKAEKPMDTVKDTSIQVSPVKETEVEAVNVASPIQKSSLPDENRPKRTGQTKRKKNMVKEDTTSKNASEGPNIGEVNKKRRTMKKQHNLSNNVDKALNEGVSKNDAGDMSDSEARCVDSGELGGASNMKENRSLLKEDGRRGGRVKPKFEEETSKHSAGDYGKDTDASLSPAKSAEDDVSQEETPRTDSKRKRASGKYNNTEASVSAKSAEDEASQEEAPRTDSKKKRASGKYNNTEASLPAKSPEDEVSQEETPRTDSKIKQASGKYNTPQNIKYGKNLIGSKVKVLWPDDDEFYEGVIESFDHIKKKHKVVYADGDEEQLNLRKEEWKFVTDDSALDGGKSAEHSGQGASSKKNKKKGANLKTPNKHEKMNDPPKRKFKGSATKSGSKSKNDVKAKPDSPENSEDGTDKSEEHSEENEVKLSNKNEKIDDPPKRKLKGNATKSGSKSKKEAKPESPVNSEDDGSDKSDDDHSEENEVKSPESSAKASGRSQPSLKKQAIQRFNNSKGKSAQIKKTAGSKKSSSSKGKESVEVEKKLESVKSGDTVKGGKSGGSGKKRRK